MFTVIFADKEHIASIEENRLFFEPLLKDKKNLEICEWNTSGQTLSEFVPRLHEIVGRNKRWRAIIINNRGEKAHTINPFDAVGFDRNKVKGNNDKEYFSNLFEYKKNLYDEAITYPLQKLLTVLCHKEGVNNYSSMMSKNSMDWVTNDLQKRIYNDDIAASEELSELSGREALEFENYKKEAFYKNTLRDEFVSVNKMNIQLPEEVICITERITENGFFDPSVSWQNHFETDYSKFVDRNMYYEKVKFLAFDIFPTRHKNYRSDLIRFLYNVLIISSNDIPSGAIKSGLLYVIESDNDDTPLNKIITSYVEKLNETADNIQLEINRIEEEIPNEIDDKEIERIFKENENISINLDDKYILRDFCVDTRDYGLTTDCPRHEHSVWDQNFNEANSVLEKTLKQPRRTLRKSVVSAKSTHILNDVRIKKMNSFQIEDIQEKTQDAEEDLVDLNLPDIFDVSRFNAQLEEQSKKVKKIIDRRMYKKTAVGLGLLCLGVLLLPLVRMLINNRATPDSIINAIITIGVVMIAFALELFITLLFLRLPLWREIKKFNKLIQTICSDIQKELTKFGKYLGKLKETECGYGIIQFLKSGIDLNSENIKIRKSHQAEIRRRKAFIKKYYNDFIFEAEYADPSLCVPYDYNFGLKKSYEYPVPYMAGDQIQLEYFQKGHYITAPMSYVSKIFVRLEEIYE